MTATAPNSWSESDQKAIREQLDRIVNSGPFHQSQRRQRFLEYIVTEALAGRGDRLKGYNIALEVFDRPRRSTPSSTHSCASRPRDCVTNCANTTNRRPRRSHSHRAAQGQLHAAHRIPAGANV